jgi:DNA mismatch endonuclease, patch repair protein
MARIRSKNTLPELVVRSMAHRLGYRFRLHRRDLPGTPDLVFVRKRKAVFVHGCFWHAHFCKKRKLPTSRQDYWMPKLVENRARDARNRRALARLGWKCLVLWECETKQPDRLARKIVRFLA